MPAWTDLLHKLLSFQADDDAANAWLNQEQNTALNAVSSLRGGTNVLMYGSGFLQKPQAPPMMLQIGGEDVNGLMSVIYGMDWSKGLTLILHTPGGVVNAAESIVAYLRSKFQYIEVIVPTFAMSAGTMISLAADKIVMGRQSQLGPIDPQMSFGGQSVSARAVVEQFSRGRTEILADVTSAHVWAPILQSVGPSLLVEAENALQYGESMVSGWLTQYMLASHADPDAAGRAVAAHFNDASIHKSHGRRIGLEEVAAQGVVTESLEENQELQEHVLTAYHLLTLVFERSPAVKVMVTNTGQTWLKNWVSPQDMQLQQVQQAAPSPPPQPTPGNAPPQPNRADRRKKRR